MKEKEEDSYFYIFSYINHIFIGYYIQMMDIFKSIRQREYQYQGEENFHPRAAAANKRRIGGLGRIAIFSIVLE